MTKGMKKNIWERMNMNGWISNESDKDKWKKKYGDIHVGESDSKMNKSIYVWMK